MRRNIMATLLLSQGTPMLLMGDEVGRTQDGNNNAYCQDNEIAWLELEGHLATATAPSWSSCAASSASARRYPLLRSEQIPARRR